MTPRAAGRGFGMRWAWPLAMGLCAAADGSPGVSAGGERRSDDAAPYMRAREFFFHEARPDPLHRKFEELFGDPYPDRGFHQLAPFRPFADVQKFNDAFELQAVAGAVRQARNDGGKITLDLELPGSRDRPMSVHVNDERVLLSFGPSEPARRYRIQRTDDRAFPVPAGADVRTMTVTRAGDRIKIAFDEKPARARARP